MRRVSAVNVGLDHGIVQAELSDGRIVEVVFDEFGLPHAGRKLTTTTSDGYIIEMILPYDVRVIRKIGGEDDGWRQD